MTKNRDPFQNIKLNPKLEATLKKGIFRVGTFLEGAIQKAENFAAKIKGSTTEASPILSLEGQLSIPKLKELIVFSSDRVALSIVPSLVDKTALELREGQASVSLSFKEKGASIAVHVDIGGGAGTYGKSQQGVSSVRGVPSNLPFENGFFDFIAANLATSNQGELSAAFRELARLLSISGEMLITDFHPFGMYAKRGQNRLKPPEASAKGVEDYVKMLKSYGLKVINLRESFIDDSVRSFFQTEEEKAAFRIVKETPLLLHIFVKKGA